MSLLIKNARNVGDVYVDEGRIVSVGKREKADEALDARGCYVLPGLVNTHSHGAMTLLRGYADDMPLQKWLQERIWPAEKKLTPKLVYDGTRLAILEMVKSGTTCFNDMYFHCDEVAKASEEMGMRAFVSYAMIDLQGKEKREAEKKATLSFLNGLKAGLVKPMIAPHAPLTASEELLRWSREEADKRKIPIHIHVSETKSERDECIKATGKTPVQYLDSLGVLGKDVVAAHCVWLDDKDISILAKRGVKVSHNPVSNMKLSSGVMPYAKMAKAGVCVSLGTDGAASNNSLSMFETMKSAALLHKIDNATTMPAAEAWRCATLNGAKALGYDGGVIREGAVADLIVVNPVVPEHNYISNLVYATCGGMVKHSVINGEIVMRGRVVEGEEKIAERAAKAAEELK